MPSLYNKALVYAAQGWRVFPCEEGGKRPLTDHGFKNATTNAEVIKAWWSQWPGANIGLDIPEGTLVLDLDPRNGGPTHPALLDVPKTLTVRTPSGGWHLYFTVPTDIEFVGHWPDKDGIDVKAAGKGYVLLPPSVIYYSTMQKYRWLEGGGQAVLPTATVAKLARAARDITVGDVVTSRRAYFPWETGSRYGLGVLRNAVKMMSDAPEGTRNHALNRATFTLAQYIEGGELSESALTALRDAAMAAGLEPEEIMPTMRSAYDAGAQQPLRRP